MNCSSITEPFILYNLISRFEASLMYTSIGDILIAVNPFSDIPSLHSPSTMSLFRNLSDAERMEADPHVFGIADRAMEGLRSGNATQAIVISGESGAGKTEQTKKCLQFYAEGSRSFSSSSFGQSVEDKSVEDRLLSANPILEAFGNSKTVRNNNSSRFGKWMKIRFSRLPDSNLRMAGCHTDHYLLEKSRVTRHEKGERGFHVFYQVLRGAAGELRDSLRLEPEQGPSDFEYLRGSAADEDDGAAAGDAEDFGTMTEALAHLSFTSAEITEVLQATVGILYLGNLSYQPPASSSSPPSLSPACTGSLTAAASLLGLAPDRLALALATKERTVRSEKITSPLTAEQAAGCRDALAKKSYSYLFDWIMRKINDAMKVPDAAIEPFIGILDIFGFEIFEDNRFEQVRFDCLVLSFLFSSPSPSLPSF